MYIVSHWNFEAESDPTHGLVTYQSQDQAKAKGLASVKDGVMVLSVDTSPTLPTNGKRDSWVDFSFDIICHFDSIAVPFNRVRISSKQKWGQGLFIADFAYMPHGCGVWPAYWSVNSETWPNGGEIDILEGVNNQLGNQYTLHTGTSCALPLDGKNLDATSNLISYDCHTYPTDNRGCAFLSPDARSYGAGFNAAGGGVVAHEWNSDHVRIWQFPRNEIPNDIKTQTPNPTSWGIPAAEWSSKYCDIEKATFQHTLVIDITLCGDWPNAVWSQSGCPGTCQQAITNSSNVIGKFFSFFSESTVLNGDFRCKMGDQLHNCLPILIIFFGGFIFILLDNPRLSF